MKCERKSCDHQEPCRKHHSHHQLLDQTLHLEKSVDRSNPLHLRLCCSRKYLYPSHGRLFGMKPHTFLLKIWLLRPPTPLEFPLTFHGVGMDIFWNCTFRECVAPENIHTPPRFLGLNPPTPLEIPVKPHTFLFKGWLLRPPPPWNFH